MMSLFPTLLNNPSAQKKRDFTYFEYPENGGQLAIHLDQWKGVKTNMIKNKNAL